MAALISRIGRGHGVTIMLVAHDVNPILPYLDCVAYLAAGRFDGYWCYDNWPWDVLPGAVLVAEAGGTLTDAAGTFQKPAAW